MAASRKWTPGRRDEWTYDPRPVPVEPGQLTLDLDDGCEKAQR